ncbi:tryptophan synthase beta subunit-like PLP-dependent enzyme [Aspergillus alliaceus]|uniref:tryptophan synthase beta subunit-like PLP-dependent enzyme n=1 Tax=Petromyces alliaceus TaxID=209559 RepID=UPI0012A5A3E6|nr:tryptophan synthase beta subunit-like PLP-dependent enzyme [Aspergillus alliaceus]KAB8235864.1 tryptophan synthase beta subunit-like PLP-dependent enzyme [Aspergillus alliaceus]
MPSGIPAIKYPNVARLARASIPAFDDPYVIAGQGTIEIELLRQTNPQKLKAVFCAVRGGGLVAGIGVYLKRIAPHVKIIWVESHGTENYRLAREVVEEVVQISTDETCAAIKDAFEDTRSVIQPAGALALAGFKKYVSLYPNTESTRELVAITSGANMDFDRLRFGYCYARDYSTEVFMGISLSASTGSEDLTVIAELGRGGKKTNYLSNDELTKRHVRFLVGGRCDVLDERLLMFEFPERPGALAKFLTTLPPNQNISLFHYRNYCENVGKVLAGIHCPPSDKVDLESFLKDLGYPFSEHTALPLTTQFFVLRSSP